MQKIEREFGNQVFVTSSLSGALGDDAIKDQVLRMAENEQYVLSHIKDMEFVGDIEVLESSADLLNRFKSVGYRFKIKSNGYDILKNHFECRKEHVPYEITLDFINQMIKRYAENLARQDEDDE